MVILKSNIKKEEDKLVGQVVRWVPVVGGEVRVGVVTEIKSEGYANVEFSDSSQIVPIYSLILNTPE